MITLGSKLKLISTELGKGTTVEGVYETAVRELNSWNHVESRTTGIPAPVLMVGALALAIATGGAGASGVYSAMQGLVAGEVGAAALASATFETLCLSMGSNFIANGGNLEAAVTSTFSERGMVNLAAQVASAGILDKWAGLKPGMKATWGQIADYGARKALVDAGINVALSRENASEALHNAGINFIFNVAGRIGANKIGQMYSGKLPDGKPTADGKQLNFLTHKLTHGALGAGLGALKGDAVAGAMGGMVAELVADLTKEDAKIIRARVDEKAEGEGIEFGSQDYENLVRSETQATMDWGKLGAAVAVALAGHDVNVGVDVATNALESNFYETMAMNVMSMNQELSANKKSKDDEDGYVQKGCRKAKEKLKQVVEKVDENPVGHQVLQGAAKRFDSLAKRQAPLERPYSEYERQRAAEFERDNGFSVDSLPRRQQELIKRSWLNDFSELAPLGAVGGVGQIIDDGLNYAGQNLGRLEEQRMLNQGASKGEAKDARLLIEGGFGLAGMVVNPGKVNKVGKVVGDVANTSRKITKAERGTQALDLSSDSRLMGEYRKVKGHHVHAKKAFDGHPNYDPQKGFSISEELMRIHNIEHRKVTGAQQKLFLELGKSGKPNTIYEHNRIAVEALIEGGASNDIARSVVAQSLRDLKVKDVKHPTNIPWFKGGIDGK